MALETLGAPQKLQQYVAELNASASPEAARVRNTATHIFELAMRSSGEVLDAFRKVLDVSLRTNDKQSDEEKLDIMHLMYVLDLRRAVEQENPDRMRKVALAAEHMAKKAQSGFAKPDASKHAARRRAG